MSTFWCNLADVYILDYCLSYINKYVLGIYHLSLPYGLNNNNQTKKLLFTRILHSFVISKTELSDITVIKS